MKKLSAAYLERAAIHYLGRFSSTEANLRQVLKRKAQRRVPEGEAAPDDLDSWIEAILIKCRDYGYVNDESYARIRAGGLARKGMGERRIVQDMTFKGVPSDMARDVVHTLQEQDQISDRSSALYLARKRRLGPYRGKALDDVPRDERTKLERREMGVFARFGFGFDVARHIIYATDIDQLEDEWEFRG